MSIPSIGLTVMASGVTASLDAGTTLGRIHNAIANSGGDVQVAIRATTKHGLDDCSLPATLLSGPGRTAAASDKHLPSDLTQAFPELTQRQGDVLAAILRGYRADAAIITEPTQLAYAQARMGASKASQAGRSRRWLSTCARP